MGDVYTAAPPMDNDFILDRTVRAVGLFRKLAGTAPWLQAES